MYIYLDYKSKIIDETELLSSSFYAACMRIQMSTAKNMTKNEQYV